MEGGLEKIQTLEDSLVRTKDEKTVEIKGQAPVFTVPLSNVDNLREGESAHFEARLTPTDDPKLKVRMLVSGLTHAVHEIILLHADFLKTILKTFFIFYRMSHTVDII